jgi:hypothetical protein
MFTVRLPFQLAEGKRLTFPEGSLNHTFRAYSIELQEESGWYALYASGLPSEEEAHDVLRQLVMGLYWAAVEQGIGVSFRAAPQTLVLADDPAEAARNLSRSFGIGFEDPVRGLSDGDKPAIFRSDQNIRKIYLSAGKVTVGVQSDRFVSILLAGSKLGPFDRLKTEPKLKLALDLYCISHFEVSAGARFLTMCTALEVAAPSAPMADRAVQLIDGWRLDALRLARQAEPDSQEQTDLQALANRVGNLKTTSHSQRIKNYVRRMIQFQGGADADELAKEILALYSLRGTLVHDGVADLGSGATRLDEILRRVLMAHVRSVACRP